MQKTPRGPPRWPPTGVLGIKVLTGGFILAPPLRERRRLGEELALVEAEPQVPHRHGGREPAVPPQQVRRGALRPARGLWTPPPC